MIMRKYITLLSVPLILYAHGVCAAPAPTVSLTQDQLSRLLQAENTKAIANYIVREKAAIAADVYRDIRKAFTTKSSIKPENAPERHSAPSLER